MLKAYGVMLRAYGVMFRAYGFRNRTGLLSALTTRKVQAAQVDRNGLLSALTGCHLGSTQIQSWKWRMLYIFWNLVQGGMLL